MITSWRVSERITIAPDALVLLIGPAGSGKSTFAERWFPAEAVISSDGLRKSIAPSGKKRRLDVFAPLLAATERRLALAALTVVDATNTDWMRRSQLVALARRYQRPSAALVFALALDELLARNLARLSGRVPPATIKQQREAVARDIERLDLEGFEQVQVFGSPGELDRISLEIKRGPLDRASSS